MRTIWCAALVALAGCAQSTDSPTRVGVDSPRAAGDSVGARQLDTDPGADPGAASCADLPTAAGKDDPMPEIDAQWQAKLTPLQYEVLRREGTERAYSGAYLNHDADGVYRCAGCGNPLYDSGTKFDQGGWPSFLDAIAGSVETRDIGGGTLEVHCARCQGHLGHIFNDGPGPDRKRH